MLLPIEILLELILLLHASPKTCSASRTENRCRSARTMWLFGLPDGPTLGASAKFIRSSFGCTSCVRSTAPKSARAERSTSEKVCSCWSTWRLMSGTLFLEAAPSRLPRGQCLVVRQRDGLHGTYGQYRTRNRSSDSFFHALILARKLSGLGWCSC
jgi:hypothetical protein